MMTLLSVPLLDRAAQLLWAGGLQFTLFGVGLLIPMAIWRRRPAARHALALIALTAALASPLTAAWAMRWGPGWSPIPGWMRLAVPPEGSIITSDGPDSPPPASSPQTRSDPPPAEPGPTNDPEDPGRAGPQPPRPGDAVVERPSQVITSIPLLPGNPAEPVKTVGDPESPDTRPGPTVRPRADGGARSTAPPDNSNATIVPEASIARLVLRLGFAAWSLGVLAIVAYGIRARARLGRLLREARPVDDRPALDRLRRIAEEQGLASPPRLLATEAVASPFVVGSRRPSIVVPDSLLKPGDEAMLGHVLAHECAHVARGDLLVGRLQGWAETLGWPHPLVRLYGAILSHAREELCDGRVLQHVSPTDYARTLLGLGERLSGLSSASAGSMFPRRHSLRSRIARLLDPRRDPAVRLGRRHRAALMTSALAAATFAAGIGPPRPPETARAVARQGPTRPAQADREAADLVRALASRSADWIGPTPGLETLEYDFIAGTRSTPIRVTRGERRRHGVWMGATLHGGFRELMRSPERFDLSVEGGGNAGTITIVAEVKDRDAPIRVEAGNGVEVSWSGYFSHGATSTRIVVDADRLVPLEEQTGSTTIRYDEWHEVGPGRWVPLRVDVLGSSAHYRMHFSRPGDAVWLLRRSESVSPGGTRVLTRTDNVRANGRAVTVPETDAERRSREAAEELRAMLDRNRPWLDAGEDGAGWRPPFRTLSYTFHTVREDVREACVLDADGRAAFEVTGDGLGTMGDRLGDRQMTLGTPEYARSRRGGGFARIWGRSNEERDQPTDLALKQFARMGCQFDLPLFRYRGRLDSATVAVEDGAWDGRPCRVATVSGLGGGIHLGGGTMFATTSWSYVHHISPDREVISIDPERGVPLHETLTSSRDGRTFEIDFDDYVEVTPGQWAPLAIRIESPGYFTCEYRFRLVAGSHWMLAEVASWFDPEDKSRGVVEDIRVDGDRALLDDALRQVEATRALFSGVGEPDRRVDVATVPFTLGRPMRAGPYEIRVTMEDRWTVAVAVSTEDPDAPGTVPLGFLDERGRLLFAPSITLEEQDGNRQGSVAIRGSRPWRTVRSLVVPGGNPPGNRKSVGVVPLRWGEPIAVNIPDAREGEPPQGSREKMPRDARTRAFRARADRADDGGAEISLELVSLDGMHEFELDLTAMLLGPGGEPLAAGQHASSLRVVSDPVEQRFTIATGPMRPGIEPRWLLVGVSPGDVISAPLGSTWGTFLRRDAPFEVATLLDAPDDACRRVGLDALGRWETDESIEKEFLGDRIDERRVGDGRISRRSLLRPHADVLARILRESDAADVKAAAARFLAYSEADGAAEMLEPLVDDPSPIVRDSAAVGLTFLGREGFIERLRQILAREAAVLPENDTATERAEWESSRRLEEDALIALTHPGSDEAIDLLGETLLGDIEALRLVTNERGQAYFDGRNDRARRIGTALGRGGNPRAVRWLISAIDLVERRSELAEHFRLDELLRSLMTYQDRAADRIASAIASGPSPGAWAYALDHEGRAPAFIPAVRALFRRDDAPAHAKYHAALYLWNLEDPEADDALRLAYDLGVLRDEHRYQMRLCEALAARGDGRGLADAFATLVDLERPAESPEDEEERKAWQKGREDRRSQAEGVFGRASGELLTEFLSSEAGAASPEERLVALRLLWRLPGLPDPFAAAVPRWAEDSDPRVAEAARRLLDRD